jgi:hypothetical protein
MQGMNLTHFLYEITIISKTWSLSELHPLGVSSHEPNYFFQ